MKNEKNIKDNAQLSTINSQLNKAWEMKKLGDVLVKTETIDPTKNPEVEFIYLDVSSVNKETKEIENATTLLGKEVPTRARKLIKTNDVIFATVRPTHSRVAIIPEEYDNQVCSTGYFVLRGKNFMFNKYIYYFLLTNDFNLQMEKLQKGASYPAVTDSEVKNLEIPVPPLLEQQRIVAYLDASFATLNQAKANLQKNLQNAKELFETELRNVFENKGEGWEEKSLGEIADVEYGYTDKSTEKGDFRYVRITDIDKNGELILEDKKYINYSKDAENFLIQKNDLLMARTGATFAKVLLFNGDEPSVFASYLIRIKFKVNLENALYWYFTKTKMYWNQANSLQTGAAQPHFNGAAFKQVIFTYPKSTSEQIRLIEKFEALLNETQNLASVYQTKLNNIEELRSGILKRAFEGQID